MRRRESWNYVLVNVTFIVVKKNMEVSYLYLHALEYLTFVRSVNPLKPELNPICYLLTLLGAHHFLHVSRIRVKLLTLR